jgi:hypothetical protein
VIAPEEPGEQISRDEFQELVRDLDIEGNASGAGAGGSTRVAAEPKAPPARAAAAPDAEPEPEEPEAVVRDPAADLTPEDLVLKEPPKRREKTRRPRNRRHGRSR